MTNAPAVSVVIPLFNAEKFIAECLESILAQTLKNIEVVVVDDCSTDGSVKIVRRYEKIFGGRLKLAHMKKNSGAGASRNKGLKLSRGEYVYFVDADDLIVPTALEELYTSAKNFSADVVYIEKHYEANSDLTEVLTAHSNNLIDKPTLETINLAERVRALISRKFFFTTCSKFVRRDFLIEHEIFFPPVAPAEDDIWTYALIFYAERLLRVPNPVYVWRLTKQSASRKEKSAQETLAFWLNPIIFGIKTLDKFMNRIEFFKQKPQYRCAVLEFFVHSKIAQVFETSLNLSLPEIFAAIEKDCGKNFGEHEVLISFLLADLITQQKNFVQLKNK